MKINKKGSVFFGVIVGIFIYIMGVLFIPFVIDDIDTSRDAFDCTNPDITDATKLNCLITDATIPYLIVFFISLLLGFIVGAIE